MCARKSPAFASSEIGTPNGPCSTLCTHHHFMILLAVRHPQARTTPSVRPPAVTRLRARRRPCLRRVGRSVPRTTWRLDPHHVKDDAVEAERLDLEPPARAVEAGIGRLHPEVEVGVRELRGQPRRDHLQHCVAVRVADAVAPLLGLVGEPRPFKDAFLRSRSRSRSAIVARPRYASHFCGRGKFRTPSPRSRLRVRWRSASRKCRARLYRVPTGSSASIVRKPIHPKRGA